MTPGEMLLVGLGCYIVLMLGLGRWMFPRVTMTSHDCQHYVFNPDAGGHCSVCGEMPQR